MDGGHEPVAAPPRSPIPHRGNDPKTSPSGPCDVSPHEPSAHPCTSRLGHHPTLVRCPTTPTDPPKPGSRRPPAPDLRLSLSANPLGARSGLHEMHPATLRLPARHHFGPLANTARQAPHTPSITSRADHIPRVVPRPAQGAGNGLLSFLQYAADHRHSEPALLVGCLVSLCDLTSTLTNTYTTC